tara:strand:- start:414 stop:545 length:132 start_codon:yes stop_codon:yes gene_type:complete
MVAVRPGVDPTKTPNTIAKSHGIRIWRLNSEGIASNSSNTENT